MAIYFQSKTFLRHETGAHPESALRLETVMNLVSSAEIPGLLVINDPQVGSEEPILRVHPQVYLDELQAFSEAGGGRIESDTVMSRDSFDVTRYAACCAVEAVDQVLKGQAKQAFCALRPPGHHALADRAMGFCLLNNVAVAARHAVDFHGLNRVLIVDWDVHHGNGTQDIFYEEESVYFFSAHRHPFYPGTGLGHETGSGAGQGTIWNLPLAFGISRQDYLSQFERMLVDAAASCRPDLILISAGFDAHKEDPIGSLGLETEDFGALTRLVKEVANDYCQGRIVSLLEGGYHPQRLAESVACHLTSLTND